VKFLGALELAAGVPQLDHSSRSRFTILEVSQLLVLDGETQWLLGEKGILQDSNIAMENGPFIDDLPLEYIYIL
jgi:hypothetical protein